MSIIHAEKRSDPNVIGRRITIPLQASDLGELIFAARQDTEELCNLINIPQSTIDYEHFDMDDVSFFTLQGITLGATPTDVLTVTIEATTQDDGTPRAACDYVDVTNALFGVAAWVDTNFLAICDVPVGFKYVRVRYATSAGGGNDCALQVHLKKMA